MMNIPILNITATDSPPDTAAEDKKNYLLQIGILSSALEHAVPEQLFTTDPSNPADAISAVKALSKASEQGQRIYHITQVNQGTALPNINHDQNTMAEIRNALNVGKEVITHTDAVSVPGWSGAGYIILDPRTGDGAYKIGGGANGGWYTLVAQASATILGIIFFHILLLGPVAIYLFAALMAVTFLAGILAVINGPDFSGYANERALISFFGAMPLLVAVSSYLAIELAIVEVGLALHVLLAELYILLGG